MNNAALNTSAPSNVAFCPSAGTDQPSAPTADERAIESNPKTCLPVPLIDCNCVKPDGSTSAMLQMLKLVGAAFQGDAFLGVQSGGAVETFSSRPGSFRELRISPLAASAVLEASHATSACLFAGDGQQSSVVLKSLKEEENACLVLGVGVGEPGERTGVVVCIPALTEGEKTKLQLKEVYAAHIESLKKELPGWIEIWMLCRVGKRAKQWSHRANFYRSRKGKVGILVAAVLLVSLAIPLPYWPRRECVVEPASRRFMASPVKGRVIGAQVRPGDVVDAGQLLARIDDEQLRWDLAAAEADYESAAKRRESALATRAGGEMRIAQLDQERISIEIDSIEKQLSQLEILSPFAGVVVQGDWFQSDGAPVERGDTLFEVSPLEKMKIETHLSTEDLGLIRVGEIATVRVDAAQGESWHGELARIDPRGHVVDSKVVFVAEMEVDNRGSLLRPGMKGSVRLSAGTKSLGWLLFHRPYVWAMKKLAW